MCTWIILNTNKINVAKAYKHIIIYLTFITNKLNYIFSYNLPKIYCINTYDLISKIISVKVSIWPKFKRGGELNPFQVFSQTCFSMWEYKFFKET